MNIVQINTLDTQGGGGKIAMQIHNYLKEQGNSSNLFVKIKHSLDLNVHPLRDTGVVKNISNVLHRLSNKNLYDFLKYNHMKVTANDIEFFKSNNLFSTQEFKSADIVHCHSLHGNYFPLSSLISISKQKKLIWTLHDMWAITGHCTQSFGSNDWQTGCINCKHNHIYQELAWNNSSNLWNKKRKIYSRTQMQIVVPCIWLKRKVEKSILKEKPIVVIENGVNTNLFKPVEDKKLTRQKLNLPINKKIIIFVAYNGLSNSWKGGNEVWNLIQENKDNRNYFFVCIGATDSNYRSPNLLSIPPISDEVLLAKYYQASDILLFPSTAETLPLTILEAMSSGLIVIANNVGGVSEIVNESTGYLISPGFKNLRNTFNMILLTPKSQLKVISRNARSFIVKKYNLDTMLTKYFNLYYELISEQ